MDNETLDKVFNIVFGRYAKLHMLPDSWSLLSGSWGSGCWPKFTIIGQEKAGIGYGAVRELWVGPPVVVDRGLFTQLQVNILGEDAAKLPVSKLGLMPSCQSDEVARELLTTPSITDLAALRAKRYIAHSVIKLLEQYDGLVIVEDCDAAHKILDVSSLEELLVKADLA